MEFWTTVGVLWVLMIVLIWAFFRGVHRLNGDDLSDAEAEQIVSRLIADGYVRIPEREPEHRPASAGDLDAPAA